MGKVSMNGLENTKEGKQTLNGDDSIGDEMISLTSRQEEQDLLQKYSVSLNVAQYQVSSKL